MLTQNPCIVMQPWSSFPFESDTRPSRLPSSIPRQLPDLCPLPDAPDQTTSPLVKTELPDDDKDYEKKGKRDTGDGTDAGGDLCSPAFSSAASSPSSFSSLTTASKRRSKAVARASAVWNSLSRLSTPRTPASSAMASPSPSSSLSSSTSRRSCSASFYAARSGGGQGGSGVGKTTGMIEGEEGEEEELESVATQSPAPKGKMGGRGIREDPGVRTLRLVEEQGKPVRRALHLKEETLASQPSQLRCCPLHSPFCPANP